MPSQRPCGLGDGQFVQDSLPLQLACLGGINCAGCAFPFRFDTRVIDKDVKKRGRRLSSETVVPQEAKQLRKTATGSKGEVVWVHGTSPSQI